MSGREHKHFVFVEGVVSIGQPQTIISGEDGATSSSYRDVVVSECPRCAPNSQPRLSGTWFSNDKYNQHLRRVFQIRLSPPQLAAVMASFDKDNDGAINCAEFLLRFFLIGFQVSGTKLGGLHLFADSGWAYISV